jgi:uncharacterized protein (UPF0210 family)
MHLNRGTSTEEVGALMTVSEETAMYSRTSLEGPLGSQKIQMKLAICCACLDSVKIVPNKVVRAVFALNDSTVFKVIDQKHLLA